jgi:flagellar motility protein MotE (MotC chaperone)
MYHPKQAFINDFLGSETRSESECDKLEKEYKVCHEYLENTLSRLRRDVDNYKTRLAFLERQNMDRLKVLKV